MTVIASTLLNGANEPDAGTVYVALVGPGFIEGAQVLSTLVEKVGADGTWSIDLIPNDDYDVDGTYYVVTQVTSTSRDERAITVPSTGGPFSLYDVLTDVPGDLEPAEVASVRAAQLAHELNTDLHAGNPLQVIHDNSPEVGDWLKVKSIDPLTVEAADEPAGSGGPHAATHAAAGSDPVTPAAIGAETPAGAQAKANAAQAAAGAYTDSELAEHLGTYVPLTQRGAANGVATLGADSKIPVAQIPDAIIRDTDLAAEATARADADAALAADLDAEEAARTAADTAADGRLDTIESALPNKADLVGGLVPTSQLPALAINDTFTVASQAAMLGLTAQRGDVAVRSDIPATFILAADDPTVLANWVQLPGGTGAVESVNTQTGVVVLGAADVGADPAGSAATAQAAAVQRANHTGSQAISTVTNLQTTLDAKETPAGAQSKADAAQAAAATDATTKANAAQAHAIQRGNHTGSQAIGTVTNLQTELDAKAAKRLNVTAQNTTAHAVVAADEEKLLRHSNAAAITVTLPSDATSAVPVGAQIHHSQTGAGQVTFAAGAGATVNGTPGLKTRAQYSAVTSIKVAADTWLLVGDLAA